MNNNHDLIEFPDIAKNANGGTEIMLRRIFERLPRDLLKQVQIVPTRMSKPLDMSKIRIAYIHDLPLDPSVEYLKDGGWSKFHKLVFVSNWQMQHFINHFNIPWSRCVVIPNGIVPIEAHSKPSGTIRLIYTPTPHRGLAILAGVFDRLSQKYDNIELDVYSSFKLYGWEDRDKDFEPLYNFLLNHPKVNYYGTVSNAEIRSALKESHIFAYPSMWQETSCLCLMEAMSAGLVCVHSNFGALYETAANLTLMYQYNEDNSVHGGQFCNMLEMAITQLNNPEVQSTLGVQKSYAHTFYNIDNSAKRWEHLITSLLNEPKETPGPVEVYRTESSMPRFAMG